MKSTKKPTLKLPRYLGGLDPGLKGGFTLIQTQPFQILFSIGWNLTRSKGYSREQTSQLIHTILNREGVPVNVLIAVEDSASRPHQGLVSTHGFGFGRGIAEGILRQRGARLIYVSPSRWKRHMGLSSSKNESVRRVARMYPNGLRAKDHDKAESLLLALWLMWDIAHAIVSPQTHGKFGLMS